MIDTSVLKDVAVRQGFGEYIFYLDGKRLVRLDAYVYLTKQGFSSEEATKYMMLLIDQSNEIKK